MKNILIIDDEIHTCTLLRKILIKEGFDVDVTMSGSTALKMVKEKHYQVVFCDYRLKDKEKDGATLSREINLLNPHTAIIIMTGYPDVRIAIQFIRNGVYDYITKPLNAEQIVLLANKAYLHVNNIRDNNDPIATTVVTISTVVNAQGKLHESEHVFGNSSASKELHQQINLIAPTNYSVIIFGETGTGKESVARLIHSRSKRSTMPFVALDCGSLTNELAASELFGHQKGAFTGAINANTGAFQQANGGTLFLDEVANLSYNIQVALLRVMQERVVRPVGSSIEIPVDIRIIVASNENLPQAISQGKFREDLFYRLNEFTLTVPPLRNRLEDLPLFVETFVKETENELQRKSGPLSPELLAYFNTYSWPGNIRELKNVIRRACLLTPANDTIDLQVLPEEMIDLHKPVQKKVEKVNPPVQDNNLNLKAIAKQAEHEKIMTVLREVKFNKTKAARLMNIDRKTLYNKLQLLDIKFKI
ncbi:two-component system, NtrC family, response regulator HydG [Chitinophaga sp. CF118]|uniref:sigma-54-dependent transcriptional regulator n=1 Tax=Chitinophaga sp. CF118 TaxID=1884367 RepID=UPI0008F02974|nr:sigma-54 dependent transcriptional regulator [Chitinophaga sp. CF118]SFD81543.1 two-component system, NtrC family, response regulator HydG [Chitinophaga sp. CF118]